MTWTLLGCALIRMGDGYMLRLRRRWQNGVLGGRISVGGLGMGGGEALVGALERLFVPKKVAGLRVLPHHYSIHPSFRLL